MHATWLPKLRLPQSMSEVEAKLQPATVLAHVPPMISAPAFINRELGSAYVVDGCEIHFAPRNETTIESIPFVGIRVGDSTRSRVSRAVRNGFRNHPRYLVFGLKHHLR